MGCSLSGDGTNSVHRQRDGEPASSRVRRRVSTGTGSTVAHPIPGRGNTHQCSPATAPLRLRQMQGGQNTSQHKVVASVEFTDSGSDDDASTLGTDSEVDLDSFLRHLNDAGENPPESRGEPSSGQQRREMEIRRMWAIEACKEHPLPDPPRSLSESEEASLRLRVEDWCQTLTLPLQWMAE